MEHLLNFQEKYQGNSQLTQLLGFKFEFWSSKDVHHGVLPQHRD